MFINKKQKIMLARILLSILFFMLAFLAKAIIQADSVSLFGYVMQWNIAVYLFLFFLSYLTVALPVLKSGFYNIKRGKILDENFLMCTATIGAFFLREFTEGVAVMLFYTIGEFFQSIAVNRSRKSISSLMDIRPDYANLKTEDGEIRVVDPYDVNIGDIIIVKPGEKIALDGEILEGYSMLDTAALTGESLPQEVQKGDTVLSGSINTEGVLNIRVTKEFSESTASKILDLMENASSKKSNPENFITKFARVYTPIVVGLAVLIAVLGPLVFVPHSFGVWMERALTFLVVSCPCALVISVPLSFFGGVGASSKVGILIKGSNYLEALAHTDVAVFDKTGTLTEGNFELAGMLSQGIEEKELLEIAAYAEYYSSHPIALSVQRAFEKREGKERIDKTRIREVKEISGRGMYIKLDQSEILAGNAKLMKEQGIEVVDPQEDGGIVHVAKNGVYKGCLLIRDHIKKDAKWTITKLKELGVSNTVMLTGDSDKVARRVGNSLGMNQIYAKLLPGDKLRKVEELVNSKNRKGKLIFVGDGINDAPVLARADVGIAMGALGSDAAIEAADIVIMNDEPSKILTGIEIARRTVGIANQNIVFALGVKIVVLILAFFGFANMWAAVFADVGVTMIAILNAMRNLNTKNLHYVAK